MKKIMVCMLTIILGISLLAGCAPKEEKKKATKVEKEEEACELYVFIAASLKNSMEEIKTMYEKDHPNVTITYNADSSGTLQTQIEEGAQCDIFFSAATKQMTALNDGGYVIPDSIVNLLENKIVLIKAKGAETTVTGFENITNAANLALAGEDVPVGQYARKLFNTMGTTEAVMGMEINEGANVTAVLTSVSEKSNEVGIVYATDAASMPESVEIIAEATAEQVDPAIYPVGLIKDEEATSAVTNAAQEFVKYLRSEQAMEVFKKAGFIAVK
ncbi:molybdate ABC transporter substrate-binding protein [Lachnospiraceae bacterium LCP25S3_G4]